MNKNYITENISIETMAKLTDEMLNFEKEAKHRNIGSTILRIVPAVAAIVLVIGLANFMGLVDIDKFLNYNDFNDFNGAESGAAIVEEIADNNYDDNTDNHKLPDIEAIESEFALRDPDRYAHVRFGENKNILLLDVEWHTPETYAEVVEAYRRNANRNNDWYESLSDEKKAQFKALNKNMQERLKEMEKELEQIKTKSRYTSRTINEKNIMGFSFWHDYDAPMNISGLLDSDGYYIYDIYPHTIAVCYDGENGEQQTIYFGSDEWGRVYSKQEFDYVIENEAISVLDELLEKGLIAKEYYDNIIKDPLDKYVEIYFGTADEQ